MPGLVLLELVRERRARPDERHVAAQHVPELRQLVEARLAQEASDRRDPRVAGQLEERGSRRAAAWPLALMNCADELAMKGVVRVHVHRAELQHRERLHRSARPAPAEEDRPAGLQLHQRGDQQEQRRQQHQERRAAGDVQPSLDRAGDGTAGRSQRKRDGIGRRRLVRVRDRRIGRNVDPNRQPVCSLEIRSAGELLTKPIRESLADTVNTRRADPRQKDADGARPDTARRRPSCA